jgi:hypothetical protein
MATSLPFMTSYDPPGTSEGTLDPLGLYQIADQLAVQLVPAVRPAEGPGEDTGGNPTSVLGSLREPLAAILANCRKSMPPRC